MKDFQDDSLESDEVLDDVSFDLIYVSLREILDNQANFLLLFIFDLSHIDMKNQAETLDNG